MIVDSVLLPPRCCVDLGADRTIRIWNNRNRAEIARLSHNAPVVAVAWMEGDTGVVSLGDDGIVSKWTRTVCVAWIHFVFSK